MASPLTTNLPDNGIGAQLQQDERSVDDVYNYNMKATDLSGLDMRAMQMLSSLLSIKMTVETNMIKWKAEICKKCANNIVP